MSPRHRPEIDEADGLDALGLDLVERPDAFGIGGQFLVDRVEAILPMPLVRFELALLVVVEIKQELRVPVLPCGLNGTRIRSNVLWLNELLFFNTDHQIYVYKI